MKVSLKWIYDKIDISNIYSDEFIFYREKYVYNFEVLDKYILY